MTGGRVPVSGGMAWGEVPRGIGIRSLEKYRSDKASELNWRDARKAHKQIRMSVNLYRLAHGTSKGTGPQTRTNIVDAVNKVKKNAAGVVRSECKEKWLNRLYDALSVKAILLTDLYYAMIREGVDIWSLKSRIDMMVLSSDDFNSVKILATLEPDNVIPKRGHPDPPLVRLVTELTPLWRHVTGTSEYPKNNSEGGKDCPFNDWLVELIKAIKMYPPPENSIPKIIRNQKSKNKAPR